MLGFCGENVGPGIVEDEERFTIEELGEGIHHLAARYGCMEDIAVPALDNDWWESVSPPTG